MDLQGKVVFVTGAARGIGAAVAKELAARGARIALAGLEPDELAARAAELGPGHTHRVVDVTDRHAVRQAVDSTVAELGGIDVVIANAGIGTYGTVEHGDVDAWLRTVDVNLNGVFHTVHAALPHVIQRQGYVLVIASVASFMALPGMSSYGATKAAVEAFVRALRSEVGFRGVGAGTAHPSWIDTDLVREATGDLESFRYARSKLPWPLKSTTSVEECALAIVRGIEKRKARIFVPRSVAVLYWLRSVLNSRVGEGLVSKIAKETVPMMERELSALGRPASARTARINGLGTSLSKSAESRDAEARPVEPSRPTPRA